MAETDITVEDAKTIVSIIDVCSQRGAFKGEELAPVGFIRTKLVKFVDANTDENTEKTN